MTSTVVPVTEVATWVLQRMVDRGHPRAAEARAELGTRAQQLVDAPSHRLLARDLAAVLSTPYGVEVTVADVEEALPAFLATLQAQIAARTAVAR